MTGGSLADARRTEALRGWVMTRVLAAVVAASMLSACANAVDAPSYLGMPTGSIEGSGRTEASAPAPKTPDVIRHVSSNRVLGAIAFQKVTGAEVDPRTLAGRKQP